MPHSLLITYRAISSFLFLLLLARLLGKKHVSHLTFFDYVVGITIGSIAADLSCDIHVKTLDGFIALIIWGGVPVLIGAINLKSYSFRRISDGKATILIEDGKILGRNLKKQRLTIQDLLMLLREKDTFKLSEVQFAILERNGQLSVFKKAEYNPLTPKVAGISVPSEREPRIVILDGNIMRTTLNHLNFTEEWLLKEITKQGAFTVHDVFLAQLAPNGELYVDLKQDSLKKDNG